MLDRRQLLFGMGIFSLGGCMSSGSPIGGKLILSESCNRLNDPLSQSLCRQKEIRDNAITHLTIGVAVGAAMGLGVAVAIGGNPLAAALIGAGLGGAIVLAERYWAYKLELANNNIEKAVLEVRNDIAIDIKYASAVIQDIKLASNQAIEALKNESKQLLLNYNRLQKTDTIVRFAEQNTDHTLKTSKAYKSVCELTPISKDKTSILLTEELHYKYKEAEKELEAAKEARRMDAINRSKYRG